MWQLFIDKTQLRESPRTWGWGTETPPHIYTHSTETKRNCIERKKQVHAQHAGPPQTVQHFERGLLGLLFLQRKRESGRDSQPIIPGAGDCLVGALLWSCPRDYRESAGLNYWESGCEGERGGGACNNQHSNPGRPASFYKPELTVLFICRVKSVEPLGQGTQWVQVYWFGSSNKVWMALRDWLAHRQARELSHSHICWGGQAWLLTNWPEGLEGSCIT